MSDDDINEVRISGRVSAPAHEVTLPSGDVLVSLRLVIRRPPLPARGSRVSVDTVDCVAWGARAQQTFRAVGTDDRLEVSGTLRRRFWRGASGPVSRYEVEARRVKRLG